MLDLPGQLLRGRLPLNQPMLLRTFIQPDAVQVLGLLPNYSLLGQMSAFGGAKKETALLADSGELNIYLLAQCSGSTGQRSQRQAGVRIIQ